MKTNAEFTAMSAQEQAEYFESLTKEEVKSLTRLQGEAYAKWSGEEEEEEEENEEDPNGFLKLTSAEIAEFTKAERKEYDEFMLARWKAQQPTTQKEAAQRFFDDNENYHEDFVYVTSDLVVFHGNAKGFNNCLNHLEFRKNDNLTYSKFSKPE